jgi:hypothetical protein
MSKKFLVEKQVEYKNGVVDTWYMIKLEEQDSDGYVSTQFIDCCKDDEAKALELLDKAVNTWVPSSKSILKEIVIA